MRRFSQSSDSFEKRNAWIVGRGAAHANTVYPTNLFCVILGCLILTWYFYERSPLITNGYYCWQARSFKPLLSKFKSNPFISLQVTVSESNQPPNSLQRWKKVTFVCWLYTTFCVKIPYQKPRPSSINIILTLLHRMEWFKSGLSNFVVVVPAQKPYQVQVVQNTTPAMINKIHDFVFDDPKVKVREIAEIISISTERVVNILHTHLSMRKLCARWVPRLITIDEERIRVTTSEQNLAYINPSPNEFLRRFGTMDATWTHR